MTWFKVDDNLAFHRKVVSAGNAAMGLWVRSGSWCGQHLTDGFVPDHMITLLGTRAQANRLVKSGLWVEVPGGVLFHEWNEKGRQPTAQSVREEQKKSAARQASWRKQNLTNPQVTESSHTVSHSVSHGVSNGVTTGAPSRPDPLTTQARTSGGGTTRAHDERNALAQTAHTPAAHSLVEDYAGTCTRRPPAKVLAKLAHEIDGLIAQDWTHPEITRAVTAWGDKGLDPAALHSVANEVINSRPAARTNHRPNADDRIAALQALKTGTDGPAPLRAIEGGRR